MKVFEYLLAKYSFHEAVEGVSKGKPAVCGIWYYQRDEAK